MTNTNIFNEHVDKMLNYDNELFLGRLCWYTVTEDVRVNYKDFYELILKAFANMDIKPKLPTPPRGVDVFRRACTGAEIKNYSDDTSGDGVRYNYMIRPAGSDADRVYRVIVRETVDNNGHELGYDELIKVVYNRASESIDFRPEAIDDPVVSEIQGAIIAYFYDWRDTLTAYACRELVRKLIENNLNGIRVRPSGGVYFVHERYAPVIDALDPAINMLSPDSAFHFLPLLDDGKQREMLRAAFEDESVGQIDTLIGEMGDILKGDKQISMERFASYKASYDELRGRLVDYSDLLDEKLELSATRLEIMQQVVYELIGKVKP